MNNPLIVIETPFGALEAELYPKKAPVTVENFLRYVDESRFTNSSFFRIVTQDNEQIYPEQDPESFVSIQVLQGGLPPEHRDLLPPVLHESTAETGLRHQHGVLSMARFEAGTADGSFFICMGDQPGLDYGSKRYSDGLGFAAFGQVIAGWEVLDALYGQAELGEYLEREITINRIARKPR